MRALAIACLLLYSTLSIAGDEVIGFLKTVSGTAAVILNGKGVKAEPGTPLFMNATLKTGSKSAMGITFKDNTVMSFGSNTEVVIDEFLYSPGKDQLALGAKVNKGTMEYVSGVVAKLKPEAVAVKTPTGTIGVRGTHFMVKVDDADQATFDRELEAILSAPAQ